jgi:hypothetical protein
MNKDKIIPLMITLLLLVNGTFFYFYLNNGGMGGSKISGEELYPILNNLSLKSAYTPEGQLKIFAFAPVDSILEIEAEEGTNIPSQQIIIGYDEAMMMKEEKLFSKVGDNLTNLFGLNTTIGGILEPTGTILDNIHLLDYHQYSLVNGEEGKIFFKQNSDGEVKQFYYYESNDQLRFNLIEGNLSSYRETSMAGNVYYPLILGHHEATLMKKEKLFKKTGDTISDFFGKDVVIVGVIEETNTSIDNMHLISIKSEGFN